MFLQVSKNEYRNNAPPINANDYFYRNQSDIHVSEGAEIESAGVSLPILATANDLREVVKFSNTRRTAFP